MKKGVILLSIFLIFATSFSCASNVEDFKKQMDRIGFYAKNYEIGNSDYAQLIIYIGVAEKEINALLKEEGENAVTTEDITQVIGKADYTSLILSKSGGEIQYSNEIPVWRNRLVFDGRTIQVKTNIYPVLYGDKIIYNAEFVTNFKGQDVSYDLKKRIENVVPAVKKYLLEGGDAALRTGDSIGEELSILQKLFLVQYDEGYEGCTEMLDRVIGREFVKENIRTSTKNYNLYEDKTYGVFLELILLDDCKINYDKCFDIKLRLKKDGQGIGYTFTEDMITLPDFESFEGGQNALISEMVKLNNNILQKNWKDVYYNGKELEKISEKLNSIILAKDQDSLAKDYLNSLRFFQNLFEGIEIESTSLNVVTTYAKTLYVEYEEDADEICNNKIDDNNNFKTDCGDSFCTGQVCGLEIVSDSEGGAYEKELYCIEGACQAKTEEDLMTVLSICGDGKCDDSESGVCVQDCVKCPIYPEVECEGTLIFGGKDESGCPLQPICIKKTNKCSVTSQCEQPLCGKVECIQGECVKTQISQCSQPECVDGEERIVKCTSGKEIVSSLCVYGKFKSTGQFCTTIGEGPSKATETISQGQAYSSADCASGVYYLGQCQTIPQQQSSVSKVVNTINKEDNSIAKGVTFTGNIVQITGEGVTSQGITGVIPDPNSPNALETPTSEPSPRKYNRGTVSRLTGIINTEEPVALDEGDIIVSEAYTTTEKGIKEKIEMIGKCRQSSNKEEASLVFSAAGSKLGKVEQLKNLYLQDSEKWSEFLLKEDLLKREALAMSLENLPQWLEEDYIPNNFDREGYQEALERVKSEYVNNVKAIRDNMAGAGIQSLSEQNQINVKYTGEEVKFVIEEETKNINVNGDKVFTTAPEKVEAFVSISEDLMARQLQSLMAAGKYPFDDAERQITLGFTSEEKKKIFDNVEAARIMNNLVSGQVDGSYQGRVTFLDGQGEAVYNLVIKISKDDIWAKPILVKDMPIVDGSIKVSFKEFYSLINDAKENKKYEYSYALEPRKFRVGETMNRIGDFVDANLKYYDFSSSIKSNNGDFTNLFELVSKMIIEK